MMTTVTPSSLPAASLALRSRSARRTSNFFLLASVARSALPRGRRKLRAYPSFTRTVSPMCPSLPTRSSKITSIELSPFWSSRGRGGDKGRARAQLEKSVDDAEGGENRKRVFRPENAAGVERDQHEGPHLEAARQRVCDREPLQRQRCAKASDTDGEILRRRSGQGVEAGEANEEGSADRPGKRERRRHVGPWPRKVAGELRRASRCIKVDAQHDQRRAGDRRRPVSHE